MTIIMDNKVRKDRRENPQETANLFSVLVYGWLMPIFRKRAKRELGMEDLYDPLKSDESERLGDRLEREWNKELMRADEQSKPKKDGEKEVKRKPNLMWAIIRMFWAPYMVHGLWQLLQSTTLHIMEPILQGWIIRYFNNGEHQMTRNQALIWASLLVIVTLGNAFINSHITLRCRKIGMCIRIACCSMIYRKVLRLNLAAVNNTAAGQVANLISNDVARFDVVFIFLHVIWIMPIQVSLLGYVMWQSVGVAALAGIGTLVLLTIFILGYVSKLIAKLRSEIAVKTDERVQLMSELISGIQVVKMYSWEESFHLIVTKVRELEMKLISYGAYLSGFHQCVMVSAKRIALYLTLVSFVFMGNPLSAEISFGVASQFNILLLTCGFSFPLAICMAGETAVTLRRLTDFLLLDEVECTEKTISVATEKTTSQKIECGVRVEIDHATANWIHGQLPPTLCEISIKVRSQSLCAIVGPVGSGKSSLLYLVLGELPVEAGSLSLFIGENSQTRIINRDIRISYTSQDPWLFSATIRENILFGQPYDERRYEEVTRVCALLKDFEQLSQGDLTFVGERGASLSGGQRARVNLARAVYRDAELYLLDDPLSAVDARVGRHLFEQCIVGFLKGKTRMLVTHQLQYLRNADTVVVLNRGTIRCQGTYEELVTSNFYILDTSEAKETDGVKYISENHKENVESQNSAVTANNSDEVTEDSKNTEESGDVSEEEMETGKMSNKVYWSYFSAGGNICSLIFLTAAFIAGEIAIRGADYSVKYWTSLEILRVAAQLNESVINNGTGSDHQEVDSPWFDKSGLPRSNHAVYVYTACIVACILLVTLRSMLFMRMCMTASRKIHDFMFANFLQATMRFFNTNPSGRILNRFSKDLGAMDELLPRVLLETMQTLFYTMSILTIIVIFNNWIIIPSVVIGGIFYLVRIHYLKTTQNLQRLEGVAKSPVFSHISSTLGGLTTIRSRGTLPENLLRREFDSYQDTHTGAWYLTIASTAAFGLFIDIISSGFVACVCYALIFEDNGHASGESVGLVITQSLILTAVVRKGLKQNIDLISQMTSVERILQYSNLPKEGPLTTENPPPSTWPSKGTLIFKDVSMRYANNKPPVLKSLNLHINAGWKIGIVGRTGAGKSSIISALFSLTGDGLEGEISLDGIDTKSIGLHELRPRISIIPQEPILFSASLRYNLDPYDQYSDAELWNSLRQVQLADSVPSLDFRVAGGGTNFSVGQRQLICLARAILKTNRLLVLDEATANVDRHTDSVIQTTVRRRFADCTVLTIAHRLITIMDSDRVLVMAGGRIVEFGHPHLLLKNRTGHFSQMLDQTGKSSAEKLAEIAESAFLLSPEFRQKSNGNSAVSETGNDTTRL